MIIFEIVEQKDLNPAINWIILIAISGYINWIILIFCPVSLDFNLES